MMIRARECVVMAMVMAVAGCGSSDATDVQLADVADESHCYVLSGPGGVPRTECFGSFSEAIEVGSEGRIVLPPDATKEDLDVFMSSREAEGTVDKQSSSYLMAAIWEHHDFGGSSRSFFNTVDCSVFNPAYSYSDLFPIGWNDRASSASAYSGCSSVVLYEHHNFSGSSRTCSPSCSDVGPAMNDRASSLRVFD